METALHLALKARKSVFASLVSVCHKDSLET